MCVPFVKICIFFSRVNSSSSLIFFLFCFFFYIVDWIVSLLISVYKTIPVFLWSQLTLDSGFDPPTYRCFETLYPNFPFLNRSTVIAETRVSVLYVLGKSSTIYKWILRAIVRTRTAIYNRYVWRRAIEAFIVAATSASVECDNRSICSIMYPAVSCFKRMFTRKTKHT